MFGKFEMMNRRRITCLITIFGFVVIANSTRLGRGTSSLADLIPSADQPSRPANTVIPYRELDLAQFDAIDNNDPQVFHAAQALAEKLKEEAISSETDLVSENDESTQKSIFGKLTSLAKRAIAPVRDYYTLAQRYRNWVADYKGIKSSFESRQVGLRMRAAADLIRIEYAKLDKKLMEDACSFEPNNELKQYEVEKVDFVLRILRLLIGRLENIMENLKDSNGAIDELAEMNVLASEADGVDGQPSDKEQLLAKIDQQEADVHEAVERAKRIAFSAVSHVASTEAIRMVKLFIFNALATSIVNKRKEMDDNGVDPHQNVLSYLEPIILLLGTANTPLVVTYLRNIQFRASLALVSHSINLIRPCAIPADSYKLN